MKNKEVLELKERLLRIASDMDQLKEDAALHKDHMVLADDIYSMTRSFCPTSLRMYAERCDMYLDDDEAPKGELPS